METTIENKTKRQKLFDSASKFKDDMERFCTSKSFIFVVAFVAFVFHALALDFWGIALFALTSALFFTIFKDFRPGLTVMLSAIFIVSTKNSPGYGSGDNYYTKPQILYPLIAVVGVLFVAMVIRCIRYRKNFLTGKAYIPLAILALALTLSGVGREYYKESFAFGLLMGLTYIGLYILFTGVIETKEGLLDYVATLLSALCLLIAVQVAFLYVTRVAQGFKFDKDWKGYIVVGWGVSNIVGEMIVFFMPFVMYKIEHSEKHSNLYNVIGLFAMTMLILTLNRSGMLFGFPIYGILWIRCLVKLGKGKKRTAVFLTAVSYFVLGVLALVVLLTKTSLSGVFIYFQNVLEGKGSLSGLTARNELWVQAREYFKDSPLIGEGFARSFNEQIYETHIRATMFQTLSHNFIFQAVGSGGIIGILVMLGFTCYMAVRFLSKYEGKFHIVCFGILFMAISLFDTTYFITYSVMFLMFITVVTEKLIKEREEEIKKEQELIKNQRQGKKLKVLFPFVEAGFGHIMTEKSICDAFEKKYGEYCEVVRSNFYKETGSPAMKKFEERLCKEVRMYNQCQLYGYASIFTMNVFGSKISSWFVMEKLIKKSFRDSVSHMEDIAPDVVVSTHWATNYYAEKSKKKPYTVMYIPDAHANALFRYPCDFSMISMPEGYKRARKFKRRYNDENFKISPLAIRQEAFDVVEDKKALRQKLCHDDKFTLYITEGGYGIGMAEELCKRLIEEDLPISVNVVCGKNPDLYNRLCALKTKGNLSFYPYEFCNNVLELIASSDLYLGKSGNGLMEAAFYGVPIVVTHSANDIEKLIAEHYVSHVKDAVRIFSVDKCVEFIKGAINGSEEYQELKKHRKPREEYGGEGIADLIFEKINEEFHLR